MKNTKVTNRRVFPAQFQGPGRIPITIVETILVNIIMIVIVVLVVVVVKSIRMIVIVIQIELTNYYFIIVMNKLNKNDYRYYSYCCCDYCLAGTFSEVVEQEGHVQYLYHISC